MIPVRPSPLPPPDPGVGLLGVVSLLLACGMVWVRVFLPPYVFGSALGVWYTHPYDNNNDDDGGDDDNYHHHH